MKKTLLTTLFIFILFVSYSQISKIGQPFIKNFYYSDYDATEQNWCTVQDNRGIIYIGNNSDGILEYDGVSWNKIEITNNPLVRTLIKSKSGIIYVGAKAEFGYISSNELGEMKFTSLKTELDSTENSFSEIYTIYEIDEYLYFCSPSKIFVFKDNKKERIIELPKSSFLTFEINKNLYSGNYNKGLLKIEDGKSIEITGGASFAHKNIMFTYPLSKTEVLIGTLVSGIFIFNLETGEVKENYFNEKTNTLLKNYGLYTGTKLDNSFIFTTIYGGGALHVDLQGNILQKIDKKTKIQDIVVTSHCKSKEGVSWFSLNVGIAKVEINSPIRIIDQEYGLKGITLSMIRFNSILYVATMNGIFYFDVTTNTFIPIKKNSDQPWTLANVDNKLLLGASDGIYEIKNNQTKKIIPIRDCYKIKQSKKDTNIAFCCASSGIMEFDLNNFDEHKFIYDKKNSDINNFIEDNEGNIWFSESNTGIVKLDKKNSWKKEIFTENKGLNSIEVDLIFYLNKLNTIIVCNDLGIQKYNKDKNKFEIFNQFGDRYNTGKIGIRKINTDSSGNYWLACYNKEGTWIEKISLKNNKITVDTISYKRIVLKQIDVIFNDINNQTLIGHSKGIYKIDNNVEKNYDTDFYTLIRKVELTDDSVIFRGGYTKLENGVLLQSVNQNKELVYLLDFKHNAINFFFAAPFFEGDEQIEYSWKLEGFEDHFTKWTKETKANYTNLHEGEYKFIVKARNIYGIESQIASYEFEIKPPWFRTIWAYLIYFVLAVVFIWTIVKLNSQRLIKQKKELERIVKERTAQVVKQKDAIEHKNKTLEKQKDEIERKNKTLEIQKEEIEENNREITASIQYAQRIQQAILPHDAFLGKHTPEHFVLFRPRDIVSGDFYWFEEIDNKLFVVAADCTGHGVPGAFMSMLGVAFLNEIVKINNRTNTSEILEELRTKIKTSLHQTSEGVQKDGMDLAIYVIDLETLNMKFSGAYNSVFIMRDEKILDESELGKNEKIKILINDSSKTLFEIKADRQPIGIHIKEKDFSLHELQLKKGDILYTFSDGFQDQTGGEKDRKFMIKNMKKLLFSLYEKPMTEQKEILNTTIENWIGKGAQIDDILVVGVKL